MQLEILNLSKVYPGNRGLLPTSFSVVRGELIAIVGHNGAGKSTLLKLLASWLAPDGGQVTVDGIGFCDRLALVRKIGFVPETPNLHDGFSVDYNLTLFARLFGAPVARVEDTLQEFKLLPFRRNTVRTLSKGLKQRLSIGRSLLADPPILLLDEPTSALDFETTKDIYRLIRRIQSLGKTILFTSHRPEEIRSLATRILVLHEGSVVFDGAPESYFESSFYRTLYT
ncbi:MAG: ABC transporter ATP-binding protein [Kiritimatiellales bacterium]|nr:ABC transporter ATP-binding protein [Kiritimatiellales bacterium]